MKIELKDTYKKIKNIWMKNPKKFILAYNQSIRIQYIFLKSIISFLFYTKQKYKSEEKEKEKVKSQKWVIRNREQKREKKHKKIEIHTHYVGVKDILGINKK